MNRLGTTVMHAVGLVAAGALVRLGWELGGWILRRI